MSGAFSPYKREEERDDIGSGAIPVSLASKFAVFLKQDLKVGIQKLLVKSPREILEDTIRNKEWFKGIVLSTAFFEHFGSIILEKHTNGGIRNSKLKLTLEKILRLLYDFKLVDKTVYLKMRKIKEERNRLVHNPFVDVDENESKRLIEDAIECLEKLGVADAEK
ncbi:MAG: hypothetical protein ACPLVJ_00090 [Candidatus Bathyarchaeales archaeon]